MRLLNFYNITDDLHVIKILDEKRKGNLLSSLTCMCVVWNFLLVPQKVS